MKSLSELSEREVIALAIASEEEDSRVYQHFADRLRPDFPASAEIFDGMAEEEREHRNSLYGFYRSRFGEHLPPIRREDVRGFLKRRAVWWSPHLDLDRMRREAEVMELQAASFYEKAAEQTLDVSLRELFTKLADIERGHERKAGELHATHLTENAEAAEEHARRRLFVLQYVQPGLAGLIDGSVSTLAPLFAAAFATRDTWDAFLVGMAASLGAGISMGLTEALSDDGEITGRGDPWTRGIVCGVMTAIGGLGHTLPFLIPDFWTANAVAAVIVVAELAAIAAIRYRYMETPFTSAIVQVILGGVLVLLTGIFIGST